MRPDSGRPPRRPKAAEPARSPASVALLIVIMVLLSGVVILADFVLGAIAGQGGASARTGTPVASSSSVGVGPQGHGGRWTDVDADQLAQMLTHKDFTLIDVKTPYSGEIDGTDLYIPYDQLAARASELPASRTTRILVYCRSGVQSAQAAQTLLDIGYSNVLNLHGGMIAWQGSGRTLVDKGRK